MMRLFLALLLFCMQAHSEDYYVYESDGTYFPTNGYGINVLFLLTPITNISEADWVAMRSRMLVLGTNSARDASAVMGDLTIWGTNQSNRGQAVVAHVGTQKYTSARAQYLAGFRTSMDLRSDGSVDTLVGYDAPQIDIEGAGGLKFGYGFRSLTLSGPGKTNVYNFASYDFGGMNFFAGQTAIGAVDSNPVYHPHLSAQLEVASTNRGILPPRMTKAQRDSINAPAQGLEIFQTDNTPGKRSFNGWAWVRYTETED